MLGKTVEIGCDGLCSLDLGDPDIAEGHCDLGFSSPEIGSMRISRLESCVLLLDQRLERDLLLQIVRRR